MNVAEELETFVKRLELCQYPEEFGALVEEFQEQIPFRVLSGLIRRLETVETEALAVLRGTRKNAEYLRSAAAEVGDFRLQNGLLSALVIFLLALPASACDCQLRKEIPVSNPTAMTVETKKEGLLKRGVKKAYKGVKWFCVKTRPVVQWLGSAAQIATPFIEAAN